MTSHPALGAWRSPIGRLATLLLLGATLAAQSPPRRIVSLVPALTDMLLAIGARPQLVGVSSYDDDPSVKALPRVGALLDPDVERILSLKPDLVLVYGSQEDVLAQLGRASIPAFPYRHGGLPHVVQTIRQLGQRVGQQAQAAEVAEAIERRIAAVRATVASAARPRTLLVFGRETGTLRGIFASGGRGFLNDMLEAAGGTNVYADIAAESVQVSSEMILARAPEVIVELRSNESLDATQEAREMAPWKALASTPAVRTNRLHLLAGKSINVPGPLVGEGVERFARVLHPTLMK
jgi:iron complex transport system substrate-binding protein